MVGYIKVIFNFYMANIYFHTLLTHRNKIQLCCSAANINGLLFYMGQIFGQCFGFVPTQVQSLVG